MSDILSTHPLIQAAHKAAEAHASCVAGEGTHTDAIAAYEALGAVLATQFGDLEGGRLRVGGVQAAAVSGVSAGGWDV